MNNDKPQQAFVHRNNISTVDTEQYYNGEDKSVPADLSLQHSPIDVPFHFRHCCWFCKEPTSHTLFFPRSKSQLVDCLHQPVAIPTCRECKLLAQKTNENSIWQCRAAVKKSLAKRHQKDLAIGKNWTQQELANADFEGGNFEGFAKSAWFIFEVARDRVNFKGWPIWCSGTQITDEQGSDKFVFDGVTYGSFEEAIEFYVTTFGLNAEFFRQVIKVVGVDKFSYAIRYSRIYVGQTSQQRRVALQDLKHQYAST